MCLSQILRCATRRSPTPTFLNACEIERHDKTRQTRRARLRVNEGQMQSWSIRSLWAAKQHTEEGRSGCHDAISEVKIAETKVYAGRHNQRQDKETCTPARRFGWHPGSSRLTQKGALGWWESQPAHHGKKGMDCVVNSHCKL